MTFNSSELRVLASNETGGPVLWSYVTIDDPLPLPDSYFSPAARNLQRGDFIFVNQFNVFVNAVNAVILVVTDRTDTEVRARDLRDWSYP
jgi:hypothetical protein